MQHKIYKIVSAFGTFLALDDSNTVMQSDSGAPVLLYIHEERKKAYLFSENQKKNIHIHGVSLQAPVIQVDLYKKGNEYSFYISNEKKFLSSHPDATIHGNRDLVDEWEKFSLHPYSALDSVKKDVLGSVESINTFLNNKKSYERFLHENDEEALFGIVANIFSLSQEDIKNLSLAFIANEKWASIVEKAFPNDIWATSAWKELHEWLSDRNGYNKKKLDGHIGHEFDFLGVWGIPHRGRGLMARSPIEFLVRNMRQNVVPRKNVCVLATGRNEGIYYLEWISYFKSIGVEGFFVYTNDNIDQSINLLQKLEKNNIIKYYSSESGDGVSVQWKAYAHALSMNPEILDYKWTIVCDIDEFLVVNKNMFSNINEYIEFMERRSVDTIAVPWCCIGASNQKKWKDLPMMDRFNSKPFHDAILVKSMFRTHYAGNSQAHFPIEIDNYHMTHQNSAGMTLIANDAEPYGRAIDSQPDFRMAVFYHYYSKSIEEFFWKSSRNRGDFAKVSTMSTQTFDEKQGNFYWEHYHTDHTDTIPMFPNIRDFREGFLEEYEYLKSLPGMENLYVEMKREFSEKISEFIKLSRKEEVYKTIPECYKKLVSLLDED